MKIFSGSANKVLTADIVKALGQSISPNEVFIFPDGERRITILERVVDEDTVIVQPTTTPADINYMELFLIADGLQRSGAKSITAVIPYLGYQRQDHVYRDGEAVSLAVIAKTLEAVGIDRVISFDLHSIRIPEDFRIPLSHLSALSLFADVIKENQWDAKDSVLVSPDIGGVRRVKILSEMLENMEFATIEKRRDLANGSVEAVSFAGKLAKRALIVDDMISSGATLVKAAELLKQNGVEEIIVFATHAILASGAPKVLQDSIIDKIYVTDTVLLPETKKIPKLEVLSVAEMIAAELRK